MSAALNQLPVTARERAGLLSANVAAPETGAASSPASPATCGPAASAAGPASSDKTRCRDNWSVDDDNMLCWFCSRHSKWARIAKAMGRTRMSCQRRARRLGVKLGVRAGAIVPPPREAVATLTQRQVAALASHEARRAGKAEKTTPRKCLGLDCGRMFPSWGAGNRLCSYCRENA